jgi:solute carrier family 35 protein E3
LNSLGFYQLMKVLTTPAIVVIQLVAFAVPLHNKSATNDRRAIGGFASGMQLAKVCCASPRVLCRCCFLLSPLPRLKLALLPICVGVALATVSDMEVNLWGVVWALAGIVSTSFYQIWVKTKQQDLGLDSYQLLFLQAPASAVLVFALSIFTDDYFGDAGILAFPYTRGSMAAIIGTGLLSFCVNLSIFLVIGKTSPVAYNVLGHFKLVCILASGFLFFEEEANATKLFGTALTFGGVLIYTHLQQNLKSGWETRDKAAAASAAQQAATQPLVQQLSSEDDIEAGAPMGVQMRSPK